MLSLPPPYFLYCKLFVFFMKALLFSRFLLSRVKFQFNKLKLHPTFLACFDFYLRLMIISQELDFVYLVIFCCLRHRFLIIRVLLLFSRSDVVTAVSVDAASDPGPFSYLTSEEIASTAIFRLMSSLI